MFSSFSSSSSLISLVAVPTISPSRTCHATQRLQVRIVSLKNPPIASLLLIAPLAPWPDSAEDERDSVDHSVQEIIGVEGVGSSAKGANAFCRGPFGLVILPRPEGVMEEDGEKYLLKGHEERGDSIGEILAGHFVGSFQNILAGQEAEEKLM